MSMEYQVTETCPALGSDDTAFAGIADGPSSRGCLTPVSDLPGQRTATPWVEAMIDVVDNALALLQADGLLGMANRAMRNLLEDGRLLRLDGQGQVRAKDPTDHAVYMEAWVAANRRGMRRMLHLGPGDGGRVMTVSGLGNAPIGVVRPCLLTISRASVCDELPLKLYAKLCALTPAESQVLELLVHGLDPVLVARSLDVRLTTVRTHISKILDKSGSRSLRDLQRRVAMLPPVASAHVSQHC